MPITHKENAAGQEFNDEVSRRDRRRTIPAFSPQNQPAEYGNIVIKLDGLAAFGTSRSRVNYGQASWNTIDTHIQKAAKEQPKHKNSC